MQSYSTTNKKNTHTITLIPCSSHQPTHLLKLTAAVELFPHFLPESQSIEAPPPWWSSRCLSWSLLTTLKWDISFLSSVCARNFELTEVKSPSREVARALTWTELSLTRSQILTNASSRIRISTELSCFSGISLWRCLKCVRVRVKCEVWAWACVCVSQCPYVPISIK